MAINNIISIIIFSFCLFYTRKVEVLVVVVHGMQCTSIIAAALHFLDKKLLLLLLYYNTLFYSQTQTQREGTLLSL